MTDQYDNDCMSQREVYKWVERFKEPQMSVVDNDKTWVHHFDPMSKKQTMQCKYPSSLNCCKVQICLQHKK
jgi:hypothetical protein